MKLWHDDVRSPPSEEWFWARTNDDAKGFFLLEEVTECSLDHDLGCVPEEGVFAKGSSKEEDGLKLVKWMIRTGNVPAKVTIHSWNHARAKEMALTLTDAGYSCQVAPFKL